MIAAGALAGAAPVAGGATGLSAWSAKGTVAGTPEATPFAGLVHDIASQTQSLDKQAATAVTGLLSGQGVEVHDVMIAEQRASAAFELALQVRNKAVSAYQQLMSTQF